MKKVLNCYIQVRDATCEAATVVKKEEHVIGEGQLIVIRKRAHNCWTNGHCMFTWNVYNHLNLSKETLRMQPHVLQGMDFRYYRQWLLTSDEGLAINVFHHIVSEWKFLLSLIW